jgi:polyisoprenoid-binding protein YceI
MKLVRRFFLAGLACLPAVAGAQSTASPNPAAKATGSDSPVAETAGPPRVLRYRFVPEQSTLTFELSTTYRVVHGKTGAWRGSVEVDPASPGTLKARLEIRAESIETGNSRRDLDVRDKVLEAAKFPEIVFEAKTYKSSRISSRATITAEVSGT